MAGYTRQSTIADGNTIDASLFNNEYNQLLAAFVNTSGHKHDGTAAEGPVISVLGDSGVVTPLNKILVDTASNHLEFYVDVSSAAVQQLRIQDGAIVPILDNYIDLGTTALEFKDGTNTGLTVGDSSQEMIATVNIPSGTTATEVTIWSSSTARTVEIYEASIDANGIGSAIGTGTANGSPISITATAATTTNYLVILVKVTNTSNRVYGGKVTLTQN